MTRYHFGVGDSTDGPIGFCAEVFAQSDEEALQILKDNLPEELEVPLGMDGDGVGYIRIYFNDANVVLDDIDEEEEDN